MKDQNHPRAHNVDPPGTWAGLLAGTCFFCTDSAYIGIHKKSIISGTHIFLSRFVSSQVRVIARTIWNCPRVLHRYTKDQVYAETHVKDQVHFGSIDPKDRYAYKGSISIQRIDTHTKDRYRSKGSIRIQGIDIDPKDRYAYKGTD